MHSLEMMAWEHKAFRHQFVPHMYELALDAFSPGSLPPSCDIGVLNCIPKVAGAAAINKLSPIALHDVKKQWPMNIVCLQVEQHFQRLTYRCQVGCVKGRQMFHHIWSTSSGYEDMSQGILVSFDFSNAFPSLSQAFIADVLESICLPASYICLFWLL